jgi:hypothetical protein
MTGHGIIRIPLRGEVAMEYDVVPTQDAKGSTFAIKAKEPIVRLWLDKQALGGDAA